MRKFVKLICVLTFVSITAMSQGVDSTRIFHVEKLIEQAKSFMATGNVDSIIHYYNEAQKYAESNNLYAQTSIVIYEHAKLYLMLGNFEKALEFFTKSADVAREHSEWKELNRATCQMASVASTMGKTIDASQYAKEARMAGEKAGYIRGQAVAAVQEGNALLNLARYEESLQCYQDAGKFFEQGGFKSDVASCWLNMAGAYYTLENFDLAIEFYHKTIDLQRQMNAMSDVASAMQNIAAIYSGYNRANVVTKYQHIDSARYYYDESIKIYEEIKDTLNLVKVTLNLGIFNTMVNSPRSEIEQYLNKAYKMAINRGYVAEIIVAENAFALLYQKLGLYEKSKEYFLKEYPKIIAGNFHEKKFMWHRDMARTLDSMGDYLGALRNYEQYVKIGDTLRAMESERQLSLMSARYGSELKDQEIAAAKERQQLMQERQNALRNRLFIMVGASIIIALFLIYVVYLFIQKRKANALLASQNEQINKQNIEIERQKNEVEEQRQEILDSIHYASRIQSAILPQPEFATDVFGEKMFVLFKPRDIVSGDFFWLGRKNNWKIAIAADCTGHGVPGAFMSMLGTAFLNEIINGSQTDDLNAGEILNELRKNIIKSLKQTGKAGEQKDGMDLALWMFNDESNEVRFAGANNPLVIVRKTPQEGAVEESDRIKLQEFESETNHENYQIIQVAGSKMPIAIYPELNPFEEVRLQLFAGDTLYTFSDGFQDQFGGEKGKKFMIKRLKQVFVNINESSMEEQRTLLDNELVNWIKIGNTEQVDDILVIGYRV